MCIFILSSSLFLTASSLPIPSFCSFISTFLSSFPLTVVAVLPAAPFSVPTLPVTVSVPVPTFSLTTEPLFARTCPTVLLPSSSPLAGVVLAHVLSLTFLSTRSSFSEFSFSFSLPTATLPVPVSTATFAFSLVVPVTSFKRPFSFPIVALTLPFLATPPAV